MNNTCDECRKYNIIDGICKETGEQKHSCAEDACAKFVGYNKKRAKPKRKKRTKRTDRRQQVLFETEPMTETEIIEEAFYEGNKMSCIGGIGDCKIECKVICKSLFRCKALSIIRSREVL